MKSIFRALCCAAMVALASANPATAETKKTFKVGYVVYVGYMSLNWVETSGTMKKWSDKYGIEVELVQLNDYVAGINQFIAGDLDAVGVSIMDQLVMPAAGGVDSTMFLLTDYSNGNDAIISKSAQTVKELDGKQVYLLQYSVSHYLLNRALDMNGMALNAVKATNISDAEINAAFITQPDMEVAVSWKPMVPDMVKGAPGSKIIFDSSQIPGEILDGFIAQTKNLKDNPDFGKALAGAWYEAAALVNAGGKEGDEIKAAMAASLGTDAAGLKEQMDTTYFYYDPKVAADFLAAPGLKDIWNRVRTFSFEQGLYGQGATSVDSIGIELPDGTVLGSADNIKIRMDPTFSKLALDGKL